MHRVRSLLASLAILLPFLCAAASGCANPGPAEPPPAAAAPDVPWSEFVLNNTGESPVKAIPGEIRRIHSLSIQSDVDGLAERIANALRAKHPALRVETVHDAPYEATEAVLDFTFECRCKRAGMPDGFYATEALVYKGPVFGPLQMKPIEPARIFFYWKYSEGAWRDLIPVDCFGQEPISSACRTRFEQADIGFVEPLAAALSGTIP